MSNGTDSTLYQQLRTTLSQWGDLTEPHWRQLASVFQIRRVLRQGHILLPGACVRELLFVGDGLLRFYCLADNGTESNISFVTENMFTCPLGAVSLNLPVVYGIQALEATTYLAAKYVDFFALYDQDPVFNQLGRRLTELSLAGKESRVRSLLQQHAKERYLDFLKQHPGLVQRVPQYHIASYLGITDVSLSRLNRALTQDRPQRPPTNHRPTFVQVTPPQ